ncbi:DNA repair protein RAD5 [Fulvia fulva]|uniref:DNA repair protein RAD5 n=1 Tax=Passalora fulva TaxID=5499 RepID=A0A9Q8PDN8_PASFU|nr:DNA repair protein RAD5 [Fulvia fulva]KAK4619062.1 DNA repair protein RAD5 [Fulvia fulva]UJO20521.1 DNA repair protein RAD5 [Fulvia fulva]WPV18285.1 DNA repair protein RAD5 [Fulvia fulva]WPV33578.1 DNA repair protein RAD5 [Fulvia fulva]
MDGEGPPQPSIEGVQGEHDIVTGQADAPHASEQAPEITSLEDSAAPRTQPPVDETAIDSTFQPDEEMNYALHSSIGFDEPSNAPISSPEPTPLVKSASDGAPRALDFGNSVLRKPPSKDQAAARQREMLEKFKEKKARDSSDELMDAFDRLDDFESLRDAPPADRRKRDREEDAFKKLRQTFERKKRAGTLSIEEEIEYMKIESRERARQLKAKADEEYERDPTPALDDQSEALFVNSDEREDDARAIFSDNEGEEEPAAKRTRKKGKRVAESDLESEVSRQPETRPRKKAKTTGGAKKPRKTAGHEYTEDDLDRIMTESQLSQRPSSSKKGAGARNGAGARGGASAQGGKGKAPAKRKGGPQMTNIGSILGTDVFEDVAQTADLRNQPTFGGTTRRGDALKQMLASLPEEDLQESRSDKKALDQAIKEFTGRPVTPAPDGNWNVKGMKTSLKHYQVLGVGFMRKRENDPLEPRGGILADQMGLGKTISMLANIVNGKQPSKAPIRATLIIAAPALVTQWYQEISKHCQMETENKKYGLGVIMRYHSGSRLLHNNIEQVLGQADIVLTTYHEVAKSYPKGILPPHLTTAAQKDAWWRDHYEKDKGNLHRVKFLRVVCDEAQAIKNHKGHTSMAVRAISARHHWAITGTPVMNSIKEFYPYFKFLREPHTGSYQIFKENFCSPDDPDGLEKLNVFLRKFMIRRTHGDKLFKARLLDLPTPQEHTMWLEFNQVERSIYEIVKNRMIARINAISKTEGLDKGYSHIWTMILRLRQLCGHILLIQGTITDILQREDFEKLNKITENTEAMNEEQSLLLLNLRQVLANNAGVQTINASLGDSVMTSSETPPNAVIDIDPTQESAKGGKHGLSYHFRKYLDALVNDDKWGAVVDRTKCSACRQKPDKPQVTSCWHVYCTSCLTDMQHFAARRGHDGARCNECGEQYISVDDVHDLDNFEARRNSVTPSEADPSPKKGEKGKKNKKKQSGDLEDWIGLKGEVLPSAKTAACKAQIMNWIDEDPHCKIIIYTQFIPLVRILAKICQTEGWKYVKYTGQESHDTRQKNIEEFADPNKQVRIMLASLKCGGLGLNLTMASRVICMDPWWNNAVEQQAFCRVFRIGQTKETRMTRFIIKNSIDAAMMAVKVRKQEEIDAVMENSREQKLSVNDLMRLFGNKVGQDNEGHPFIFADVEEDEELLHREDDEENEDNDMGNDL